MRRILGRANSSNVMKVVWLLEEMALPYQREDYGGAFGRTQEPDYLALNPNGIVPTLVEDKFSLWESNAILRYLATANPEGRPFWPEAPQPRAHVDRWMDWQQTALGPPMGIVFWGLVRTAPEKQDMEAIHAAAARAARFYGMLEVVLGRHDYVAGPTLSLADIAIAVHAHRWLSFDTITRPAAPALEAWYARLLTRPAFKAHVALPMT